MRTTIHKLILPALLMLPTLLVLLILCQGARAQVPVNVPTTISGQLQVQQPGVDVQTPVTATAFFDPPVAHAGQKVYYHVQLDATEATVLWPDKISAPPGLKFGANASGQTMQFQAGNYRPLTGYVYEVTPARTGEFTVTNFVVNVDGWPVTIPAATLEVVADNAGGPTTGRKILLKMSDTNLYLGQTFRVSVILPSTPTSGVEGLREIQINGDGLIPDKTGLLQTVQPLSLNGPSEPLVPSYLCEMNVTPMATGPLQLSAQGFATSTRNINGPITISGGGASPIVIRGGPSSLVLLMSDTVGLHVRPLPTEGRLPGFTGSIGQFVSDGTRLSANQMKVGEPVHLQMFLHGMGDLNQLVPPRAPISRDWQIIADAPPGIGFTLIPLADDLPATPEIPYSFFDPETGQYEDLTIASIPVTVKGQGLPAQLAEDVTNSDTPAKLSDLAATPGFATGGLKPLQSRGWFVAAQLLPVAGLLALMRWAQHRRYLEAHPEIVRRRRARRELRREKRRWRQAIAAGDAPGFVRSAANAMKIACAPHFPAEPQALVCADVLSQLDIDDQTSHVGETVRKIFTVADARFAVTPASPVDVMVLEAKVDTVLMKLEEKL